MSWVGKILTVPVVLLLVPEDEPEPLVPVEPVEPLVPVDVPVELELLDPLDEADICGPVPCGLWLNCVFDELTEVLELDVPPVLVVPVVVPVPVETNPSWASRLSGLTFDAPIIVVLGFDVWPKMASTEP